MIKGSSKEAAATLTDHPQKAMTSTQRIGVEVEDHDDDPPVEAPGPSSP